MRKMGPFTLQTLDEVLDKYIGVVGTEERDDFESSVAESLREYEMKEAQKRAILGDKYIQEDYCEVREQEFEMV